MNLSILASTGQIGNPAVNIGIFVAFVVITLAIVIRVGRRNTNAAEYFTGGHAFTGRQNGIADRRRLPVGSQLPRHRRRHRVYGYDGFLYSITFLVAWLVALLLVANCCATQANSPWPTCWASGSSGGRSDWPQPSRP